MHKLSGINNRGFTLIELIIAFTVFSIIAAIVVQEGRSLNTTVELENASKNVDLKIKLAKARSIGALDDKNYGVHFDASLSKVVVFDATSPYINGAAGNVEFVLPQNIEISSMSFTGGGSDVVFERLTGDTTNDGSVTLAAKNDATKTKTIFVNTNGQDSFSSFGSSSGPIIENARHTHFDLGWNIENSTQLILRWYNASDVLILEKQIDAAGYFNVGSTEFNWENTINESGINQTITIKGWVSGMNSILCIIRHDSENNKLKIYFNKSGEKHIATYERILTGVTVTAGPDGGTAILQ